MAAPRHFNHEEALVRFALGDTYGQIAADVGVSRNAVAQAVKKQSNPEAYARLRERHRLWQRKAKRALCKRCGKLIWMDRTREKSRTGLCMSCVSLAQATTVRPTALRCSVCGEWKPDGEFPKQAGKKARRGRHGVCRPCNTITRRRRRHARRVPCIRCGAPRSHPDDVNRRRGEDTGLCLACFRAEYLVQGGQWQKL